MLPSFNHVILLNIRDMSFDYTGHEPQLFHCVTQYITSEFDHIIFFHSRYFTEYERRVLWLHCP